MTPPYRFGGSISNHRYIRQLSKHCNNAYSYRGPLRQTSRSLSVNTRISKTILDYIPESVDRHSLWPDLQRAIGMSETRLILLDGSSGAGCCGSVFDVNVLLDFSIETIKAQLESSNRFFAIMTGARSLPRDQAAQIWDEVVFNIYQANTLVSPEYQRPIQFLTHFDADATTGNRQAYFSLEMNAISKYFNPPIDGVILAPTSSLRRQIVFEEVLYREEGGTHFMPITSFTNSKFITADTSNGLGGGTIMDSSFVNTYEYSSGSSSKSHASNATTTTSTSTSTGTSTGSISPVRSLTLSQLRKGGVSEVTNYLESQLAYGDVVLVNAVHQHDVNQFTMGLLEAEASGTSFLYAGADDFIASRTGMEPRAAVNIQLYEHGKYPSTHNFQQSSANAALKYKSSLTASSSSSSSSSSSTKGTVHQRRNIDTNYDVHCRNIDISNMRDRNARRRRIQMSDVLFVNTEPEKVPEYYKNQMGIGGLIVLQQNSSHHLTQLRGLQRTLPITCISLCASSMSNMHNRGVLSASTVTRREASRNGDETSGNNNMLGEEDAHMAGLVVEKIASALKTGADVVLLIPPSLNLPVSSFAAATTAAMTSSGHPISEENASTGSYHYLQELLSLLPIAPTYLLALEHDSTCTPCPVTCASSIDTSTGSSDTGTCIDGMRYNNINIIINNNSSNSSSSSSSSKFVNLGNNQFLASAVSPDLHSSYHLLRDAFQIKASKLLGQLEPMVSLWKAGAECVVPHLKYVIIPKHIHSMDEHILTRVAGRMAAGKAAQVTPATRRPTDSDSTRRSTTRSGSSSSAVSSTVVTNNVGVS